ncbi:MAG TPA: hypothetical protein VGO67_03845 [Verrucomicrobiae bacterium]|jgi:hypothetical protein
MLKTHVDALIEEGREMAKPAPVATNQKVEPASAATAAAPVPTREYLEQEVSIKLESAVQNAIGLLFLIGRELAEEVESSGLNGAGDIACGIQGQYLEAGWELRRCFDNYIKQTSQVGKGGSR